VSVAGILDIDGTLVDTNYHHAIAWYRAFRSEGVTLPLWRIHRHIGMGGDQLVPSLAGDEVERRRGEAIREAETACYMALIDEVEPLRGARDLIVELKRHVDGVVLASSAKPDEVEHYLTLLKARELVDAWTTSGDVDATKPEPDLIQAAMGKIAASDGIMIGDSVWDFQAAARAGIRSVAVLTGGFSEQELLEAGAAHAFDDLDGLRGWIADQGAGWIRGSDEHPAGTPA
jgi:phosphoglycolate phosphatase-like HAD superfamily hydrolase